jgi:hypothetical protein
MKKYILSLTLIFCNLYIYAQNIDKTLYQETNLTDAYEHRQNNSGETHFFKSTVNFQGIRYNNFMGNTNALFYQNSEFINLRYYSIFPRIERFRKVIIYYRFVPEGTGWDGVLDYVEIIDSAYFFIGNIYKTLENLRLRSRPNLSGNILLTIQKDEWVVVLEEGNVETIDGITSAWVRIKINSNHAEGWCFGGYLGFYDRSTFD